MAESTKVTLVNNTVKEGGEDHEKEFDVKHAQDLLKYQQTKGIKPEHGWSLSPQSGFEYKDGTITPTGKGADQKSSKSSEPKGGS